MPVSTSSSAGPSGRLAQQHHREDGREDRGASVEQAGDGGADVLFGDREEGERNGHPHHGQRDDAESVLGADLGVLTRERQHGERERAEADTHERDHAGRECIEADVDEQERRAPDDGDRDEQSPVGGGEPIVVLHSGTVSAL